MQSHNSLQTFNSPSNGPTKFDQGGKTMGAYLVSTCEQVTIRLKDGKYTVFSAKEVESLTGKVEVRGAMQIATNRVT